jgi:hypothetical protein
MRGILEEAVAVGSATGDRRSAPEVEPRVRALGARRPRLDESALLLRNELVTADSLEGQRRAEPNELKRLGEPIVVRVRAGAATVEVAAQSDDAELLL